MTANELININEELLLEPKGDNDGGGLFSEFPFIVANILRCGLSEI